VDYEKYRTEIINADPTFLGKHGVSESTVAGAKEIAKQALNAAISTVDTVTQLAKVAIPGVGHAASLAVNAGSVVRDSGSVELTRQHINKLQEIQKDIKEKGVCDCDHCAESVGYAISQKTKKMNRKEADVVAGLTVGNSPVPNVVAPSTAVSAAHFVKKTADGTRGKERNRQAVQLHQGARGTRLMEINKPPKFLGGCLAARAIIDDLTEHWQRVVFADDGPDIIATKLKST